MSTLRDTATKLYGEDRVRELEEHSKTAQDGWACIGRLCVYCAPNSTYHYYTR